MIRRHKSITEGDWYFNRAIFNLNCALHDNWLRSSPVRTPEFWQKSAYKRLVSWRRMTTAVQRDFVRRRLVRFPDLPDVQLLIGLESANYSELQKIDRELRPFYNANASALSAFSRTTDAKKREEIVRKAVAKGVATKPLLPLRCNKTPLHGK